MPSRTPTVFHDLLAAPADTLGEVLSGLARAPKAIAPKYFYDARGCELFEAICRLPEYYPTRTELAIMRQHAPAMARALGAGCALIEIGCGNSEKTRCLLEELDPPVFVAVDIAREQLEASCSALAGRFPRTAFVALRADFSRPVPLPALPAAGVARRALYFPGSTIGNFTPAEARAFLEWWRPALGAGGAVLVGVDLKKAPALLHAAYNDVGGVTAAFNLNLLAHLNRELGADFDLAAFRHEAFYSEAPGRIEMHLVSLRDQRVTIAGRAIAFREGETIHTESSYKYSVEEFAGLAAAAGYAAGECWTDPGRLFAVHCLRIA